MTSPAEWAALDLDPRVTVSASGSFLDAEEVSDQ